MLAVVQRGDRQIAQRTVEGQHQVRTSQRVSGRLQEWRHVLQQ